MVYDDRAGKDFRINVTRTAMYSCRGKEKVFGPWETYNITRDVSVSTMPGVAKKDVDRLVEAEAQKMADNVCKFKGIVKPGTKTDWLPGLMCNDVYNLQGGAAEKCKKLFYSKLSNIKSADEGKGLLSKADGFLSSVFRSYDNVAMTHIRITGKGIWSMPK